MQFVNYDTDRAIEILQSGEYNIYDGKGKAVTSSLDIMSQASELSKFSVFKKRNKVPSKLISGTNFVAAGEAIKSFGSGVKCGVCGYEMVTAKIMTKEPILYCSNCKNTEHVNVNNNALSSKVIGSDKKIVTLDISKPIPTPLN